MVQKNKELPRYLVNPIGFFKKVWDVLMVFILLYIATLVPYRTAFVDEESSGLMKAFELTVDVMFVLDIFLTFLTPYERRDSSYEYKLKNIAINYLSGGFAIDAVASFPT